MLEEWTLSQITGPLGGTIALSWIAGAASGWGFTTKIMKSRIAFLEEQIRISDERCEARIESIEEKYSDQVDFLKKRVEQAEKRIMSIEDSRFWMLSKTIDQPPPQS